MNEWRVCRHDRGSSPPLADLRIFVIGQVRAGQIYRADALKQATAFGRIKRADHMAIDKHLGRSRKDDLGRHALAQDLHHIGKGYIGFEAPPDRAWGWFR